MADATRRRAPRAGRRRRPPSASPPAFRDRGRGGGAPHGRPPHGRRRREAIPHEDETIRAGDPDDDSLANEYVGEDIPGGSTPTPDQSNVDEIGRAYGLQDEDNGPLRTSGEVLARRDRRRPELRPPPARAP